MAKREVLYDTKEAAEKIDCHPRTVNRWANKLNLGQIKGGSRSLTLEEIKTIQEHVRSGPGQPPKEKS